MKKDEFNLWWFKHFFWNNENKKYWLGKLELKISLKSNSRKELKVFETIFDDTNDKVFELIESIKIKSFILIFMLMLLTFMIDNGIAK